jgi:hypothetical protein
MRLESAEQRLKQFSKEHTYTLHTFTPPAVLTHIHTLMHPHTHTPTYTYTDTQTDTRIHRRTHIRARVQTTAANLAGHAQWRDSQLCGDVDAAVARYQELDNVREALQA